MNFKNSRKNNKNREDYFKKYFSMRALSSKKDFEVASYSEHGLSCRMMTFYVFLRKK